MALEWVKAKIWPGGSSTSRVFDLYVSSSPSLQNAVDAVAGWKTSFPPRYGLKAGFVETYNEPRIRWAIEAFGSLEGRRVLELEPLEGGHTSMLEAEGASVDAIEPNGLAFMRCLITKEILGLTRSTFWLGDVMRTLEDWEQRYDLIVLSRALGHLRDPLHFLELAAKRADAIYIWTRLITESPPSDPRPVGGFQSAANHSCYGVDVRVYENAGARGDDALADGNDNERLWLNRDDLLKALDALGFVDVRLRRDEPNPGRPMLSILARR
jgi:hypothetical protein